MKSLLVLVASLTLLGGCPRRFRESAEDEAKKTVEKYALEAYPTWASEHPDAACPARLADLDRYMGKHHTKDPWGNDYVLMCGPNLPPGRTMPGVMSAGADGRTGTADDITSWD